MTASIGDRMKSYERAYDPHFTPNSPVVIRVDGRSFHTFLRGAARPFDMRFIDAMSDAAGTVAVDMAGFKLAYVQSDECTFVITDYDRHETQGWFDYSLNKIVSITASAFTLEFNHYYDTSSGLFDARAFVVPEPDVPNVFVWRQRDWTRNSVQMYARSHFSHKQLHGKKMDDLHAMLAEKGMSWENDFTDVIKYGTFVHPDGSRTHQLLSYDVIRDLISTGQR